MYMILCRTKVDNCGYTRYNEKLSAFGTSKFCLLKISDIFLGTLCWFQSFEESTSSLSVGRIGKDSVVKYSFLF